MHAPAFEIEITQQGWLDPAKAEYDLCSHGDVRLVIGGEVIASGDGGEYGISEAGLAMLRTLATDHTDEHPVAELLIPHGCGAILMMGCPIGIDWSVRHSTGWVQIEDVRRYDDVDRSRAVRFPDLCVDVPESLYRGQVMSFAKHAKDLFESSDEKALVDDWHRQQHVEFWEEYNRLYLAGR